MPRLSPQPLTEDEQGALLRASAAHPRNHLNSSAVPGSGFGPLSSLLSQTPRRPVPAAALETNEDWPRPCSSPRGNPRPRPQGETPSCMVLGLFLLVAAPCVSPPTPDSAVSETPNRPQSSARKGAPPTPPSRNPPATVLLPYPD